MPARTIATGLIASLFVCQAACSLGAPSMQSIAIVPSHSNAEVFVDGNFKGTGPQSVELSKKSTHSIMAKCGDSAGVATVDRNLSTTGMLDIVGGFFLLVPFVGLAAPGAWELSPSSIAVPVPDATDCHDEPESA